MGPRTWGPPSAHTKSLAAGKAPEHTVMGAKIKAVEDFLLDSGKTKTKDGPLLFLQSQRQSAIATARGGDAAAAAASSAAEAVRSLLDELTGAPVVLLRLTLPEAPADGAQPPIDPAVLRRAHPGLERAASRFRDSCPELLDRSKTRRRECTNFC
mmetsp:Transcript_18080/g.59576  ORF Transcript_18080/g.59576 Transcript_18080/m.59576 type:complete len:155 (+) Transcript_18080:871-1335(+)